MTYKEKLSRLEELRKDIDDMTNEEARLVISTFRNSLLKLKDDVGCTKPLSKCILKDE